MTKIILLVYSVLLCLLIASCALRVNPNLDSESREFLSKVRYIITKGEKEMFLKLPQTKRPEFIEEFWKKRDPDPETEKNEFKETYFKRIEEANFLFRDGNEPGWLQDRGRIYILLGPPTTRETYPRGITFYGKPTEIWYYGFFPIWFVDDAWNGTYRLDPYSAQQLAEIMSVQMDLKPKVPAEETLVDLPVEVIEKESAERVVRITLPYEQIWFESKEEKLKTILSLLIEINDQKGTKVWECSQNYPVEIEKTKLARYRGQRYVIEVPLSLPSGSYEMIIEMRGSADKSRSLKKISLDIRRLFP